MKDIVISYTSVCIWNLYFKDWLFILKMLLCAELFLRSLQDLKHAVESIELFAGDCFYKVQGPVVQN